MFLKPHTVKRKDQRGVGLIEVLITMLVLSIGFATSARFQLLSMRENQNSLYRSHASYLIESMMEQMRNNPVGVQTGAYNSADTDLAAAPGNCRQTKCTPAQLAIEDIALWRHSFSPIDNSLPKLPSSSEDAPARGTISTPDSGIYTIELTWEALVDGELQSESVSMLFLP